METMEKLREKIARKLSKQSHGVEEFWKTRLKDADEILDVEVTPEKPLKGIICKHITTEKYYRSFKSGKSTC